VDRSKHRVILDFPEPLTASEEELALIEAWFGATIAALADEARSTPAPRPA
jgi:hypothetical protein